MDGRALSPSVGQKNTQHQLMNQTQNCISHFTTSGLIFNIHVFLFESGWGKQLCCFELRFSTQCVPFKLFLRFTPSVLRTSHNAAVWGRRTFLRSDDEGLADGVEQATVSVDEVGHVLSGGEERRADGERLRERDQTHNEPLSATAASSWHQATTDQLHWPKTRPQLKKTRPQQCFLWLQLSLRCLD